LEQSVSTGLRELSSHALPGVGAGGAVHRILHRVLRIIKLASSCERRRDVRLIRIIEAREGLVAGKSVLLNVGLRQRMLFLWSVVEVRANDVNKGVVEDRGDFLLLIVRFVFLGLLVVDELKGLAGSSK